MRALQRMDSVDPIVAYFSVDMAPPRRTVERTLTEEPKWKKSCTLIDACAMNRLPLQLIEEPTRE
jgi:hypothetical protein